MYTVIWQKDGKDRWERVRTKKEVVSLLKTIEADDEASPLEDVWVFTKEADDYAVTGEDLMNER